jgi:hypothetical protein
MKKFVLTGFVLASLIACTNPKTEVQKQDGMSVQNQDDTG